MDCNNCQKCDLFRSHSWRYQCGHCRCPNYHHNSYAQSSLNDDGSWIDDISPESLTQLDDYNNAKKLAKLNNLTWLPIGLKDHEISEFVDLFELPLGLRQNVPNRQKRDLCVVTQIPKGDRNIVSLDASSDDSTLDLISEEVKKFKINRDSNYFGFGELEAVDTTDICSNCATNYVDNDRFCVRIMHSGTLSWHVECFKCFKCEQHLVDFHYFWNDENSRIYCMKHFDELTYSRCDSCDQLIIQKDYTKAMEKDFHVDHFACSECDKSISGEKFIPKDGDPFCLKCFENKFANDCDRCSKKISCDSKNLMFDNRHWHDKCFYCDKCQKSLTEGSFAAKDKDIYCPDCYDDKFALRCTACEKPLKAGAKKFEYEGNQWHEDCFRCDECNESIRSKSFIPKNDKKLCGKCYEDKYAQKCSKCKEVILKGGIAYKGDPWHKECFLCTHCNKELVNCKFASKEDKPYCQECFSEIFSKRCKKCEKPISGFGGCKFISLEDDHWHIACFMCSKCEMNLAGKGFMTHNLEIMCPDCGQVETDKD